MGTLEPPLFQRRGGGAAAKCFGGRRDTVGTYSSRCRCRGRAREERWLCQLPPAHNRLRFLLFIPRFELRRVAAEAFGSLCKGFIASFLTSAQTSTPLAWVFSPRITLPSTLFSSCLSLRSWRLSAEQDGELGGRFINTEVVLLKEGVDPEFFGATCKDVHTQGLVLHHSLHSHAFIPQRQTKPPRSLCHSPCVGTGAAMRSHRVHTSAQNPPVERYLARAAPFHLEGTKAWPANPKL